MKSVLAMASLAPLTLAAKCGGLKKMENLVTFGDSYTDEGRLGYFINNNGEAPPAGEVLPENAHASTGGYVWPRFIAQKTGATLFNYAVSGATCSNEIIERDFPLIGQPFPSVMDYEIPAYKADIEFESLYEDRDADNTVYALWIGTNDLGWGAFLSDSQAPGTTISTFVDCVWSVFDSIYETGGRHFVLLTQAPLERSPLYNVPELDGTGDSQFWADKTSYNMTEYKYKMLEYTTNVNTMFEYGVPFQLKLAERWPGASFTLFDTHALLMDIIEQPDEYLEAPANATGYYHHCLATDNSQCVDSEESLDSFLWYDELHPSERADEIIADAFIEAIAGESKYAKTYLS